MCESEFLNEVTTFVNLRLPDAQWERSIDFALLKLESANKEILFTCDKSIAKTPGIHPTHGITETQWNSNKEASKSRLCSLLGITQRIHGRLCTVHKIPRNIAKLFVDIHHIMGYTSAHYNYGLYLKDELVAVACFSKGRPMDRLPSNKKSFELIRFCNKNYHTVVGGLSKLIRFFEKDHSPGDIMTYVDRSWGQPNAYYALGFILDKMPHNSSEFIQAKHNSNDAKHGNYKLIKHLV